MAKSRAQQAAIAIAKKKSGKYNKQGKNETKETRLTIINISREGERTQNLR